MSWRSEDKEGAVTGLVFAASGKKYGAIVDISNEKVVNIKEAKKFNNNYYIININSCSGDDGDGTKENEHSR